MTIHTERGNENMRKKSLIVLSILLMVLLTGLTFVGALSSEEGSLTDSGEEILIADNGDNGEDGDGNGNGNGNGDDDLDVDVDVGNGNGDGDTEGFFGGTLFYIIVGAIVVVVIIAIVSMTNSSNRR